MQDVFPQLYPEINIKVASEAAATRGMTLAGAHYIDVIHGDRVIRVALRHSFYVYDIVVSFEYYFSAVVPLQRADVRLVDYSTPRWHEVIGYEAHPVLFPSFSEPVVTALEYLDFAQIHDGSVVLDLGAYAGLTSILFDREVAPSGRVIAVEADTTNIECARRNLALYERLTARKIKLLHGAVWTDDAGVDFSVEGNMGSAANAIVGNQRGDNRRVPSFTLGSIAQRCDLERLDFIKCDVEGAEAYIFCEPDFFERFRPRIVIDTHLVDGRLSTEACVQQLAKFNYSCREVPQSGIAVPLLECTPMGWTHKIKTSLGLAK